jgi:CRISPR-associated protein Cas1
MWATYRVRSRSADVDFFGQIDTWTLVYFSSIIDSQEGRAVQLVINTFGARLRKEGERFLVQAGDKKLAVSAHKVRSILLATGAVLSTDAIELANRHNIDLVFLDRHGDPFARVWQTKMGSTAAIRRRQLEVAEGPEGLAFVREWVQAKLRHQQEFLEELRQRRPGNEAVFDSPLATLRDCLARVGEVAGTVDEQRGTLMGLEGTAGRVYFGCIGQLVPDSYRFTGRSRQPARDGFNAMLNYSYGVLYSLVERACIVAGLDPFVGFLHTDNYGKKSLVFDLIEPFRILGDRAALLLFTGRRVLKEWFELVPGGVALSKDGRAAFIGHLNERLDKAVRYPVQGSVRKTRNVKQRDVIQHEAHALANALLGKRDMPRVVETRRLWAEDAAGAPEAAVEEDEPAAEAESAPEVAGEGTEVGHDDLGGVRHHEGPDADEDREAVP